MGLLDRLGDVFRPERERAVRYRCGACDREFVYDAAIEDPDCPYCDADGVEELTVEGA